MAELGLKLRAGVHVGMVTRMGRSDIAGVEVHFAQRVSALAGADQVLVSSCGQGAAAGFGHQRVVLGYQRR